MKWFLVVLGCIILTSTTPPPGFKQAQLRYERVRNAFAEQGALAATLVKEGRTTVFLRGVKESRELQLWAAGKDGKFTLVKTYPFCALSGGIGPKRMEGDGQVPEGLYHIDRFNPVSNFYLSLGINYPNKSDQIRKSGARAGGDIFIHGSCVTIGCIPLTDPGIMELYAVMVEAKEAGQEKIPVYIFPFHYKEQWNTIRQNDSHLSFWKELETAYTSFNQTSTLPSFTFAADGRYLITP